MKLQLKRIIDLIRNMGPRYVGFRAKHEVLRRSGLLKNKFPAAPPFQQYITLQQWQAQKVHFFFDNRANIKVPVKPSPALSEKLQQLKEGRLLLFSSILSAPGSNADWVTNPDSGYKYDVQKHWTEIPDYSKEAGDIKYVWERSRFSYLYDIIRYDQHFGEDHAAMVFGDILSWIKSNPVNCGPNYRCSQEMSLRVLNWVFALHFYSNSPHLTQEVFNEMQHVIYWHLHHIYNNIDFSRIAVRNNHAITETLTLYLGGMFFPSMPGAARWKQKGKEWFEEEIAYQIYNDGTFLQYSMNYHRIVVQLLTWGIVLSEKNGERFSNVVYDRARKSLKYLRTCMAGNNGWLPNYGANDGALFFGLSSTHYRDYRPQLQALAAALGMSCGIDTDNEDQYWYGINRQVTEHWQPSEGMHSFRDGGYYLIREADTLTFIKCGSYKDRPSQADNLHIDIWHNGENIMPDAGSYKYNTDDATIRYFSGTRSHNTVMLGNNDQMLKGGRFIWYYWTQCRNAQLTEDNTSYYFTGTIQAFGQLQPGILHTRSVAKQKGRNEWLITDTILHAPPQHEMIQYWHIAANSPQKVNIVATDSTKATIAPVIAAGMASSLYGQKVETREISFSTKDREIQTRITIE
jgi:hypothetical protein